MSIKRGAINYTGTKGTKPSASPGKLGQMVILHKTNPHFLQMFVEINKGCPNENKQRIFIQCLLYSKRVSHHHWICLAETQKEFFIAEKKYDFRSAVIGACWHGETRDTGHSMRLG